MHRTRRWTSSISGQYLTSSLSLFASHLVIIPRRQVCVQSRSFRPRSVISASNITLFRWQEIANRRARLAQEAEQTKVVAEIEDAKFLQERKVRKIRNDVALQRKAKKARSQLCWPDGSRIDSARQRPFRSWFAGGSRWSYPPQHEKLWETSPNETHHIQVATFSTQMIEELGLSRRLRPEELDTVHPGHEMLVHSRSLTPRNRGSHQ